MKKKLLFVSFLVFIASAYEYSAKAQWIGQFCTTPSTGNYKDGGTVTPTATLQSKSIGLSTSFYGYPFWTFAATAGTTYYFDLCSSTGTTNVSRLRLHNARYTSPNNNYCMDGGSTPTLVIQNTANGCVGTGMGLSKLIWTCTTSGTYYLESAASANATYWGVNGNQTATLRYKTLPSSSVTCADVFYDKGSNGTDGSFNGYNNNEDWIYTYYPTNTSTDAINIQFVTFDTDPNDYLCVYNGNSTSAPLIGCYSGTSVPGNITSAAYDGAITFHFTSGNTVIAGGWEANVSCVASLGMTEHAANKLSIYPNPVKDKLEISGLRFDVNTKVQVFNMIGKSIYIPLPSTQDISSEFKTVFDVSFLPAGIYFVQIENGKGKWNGRFVKH